MGISARLPSDSRLKCSRFVQAWACRAALLVLISLPTCFDRRCLAGNRTSVAVNGAAPVITTYEITTVGSTYDNAGNVTNDGTATATFDALHRMTTRGGGTTTYGSNSDGVLVSQMTGGVTTRSTHDLVAPLSQVL